MIAVVMSLFAVCSVAQDQTLPEYLDSLKWDPSTKGPLVAVATNRRSAAGKQGLEAFGRKSFVVGGLTVVAPETMVVIDGSMKSAPNMYDGLPRQAKVLYLLSTLDSGQMKKAAGNGIGLGDLQGEQRAVFLSLLPPTVKWQKGVVDDRGFVDVKSKGTLSEKERNSVRLRISKAINFQLSLVEGQGYTNHDTIEDYGVPGTVAYLRDSEDDYDKGDAFGVQIRSTVENRLKKSQLDYKSEVFQAEISLDAKDTVAGVLGKISAATGVRLDADLRVAGLGVQSYGKKATAAGVLQALALGVTGTYRLVGSTFVLTSDLEGMGARKYKLSLWQADIQREIWRRIDEWQQLLGPMGYLSGSSFDNEAGLAPSGDAKKLLDKMAPSDGPDKLDGSSLPPNLRGYLERVNKRYSHQQVRTDRVGMETMLAYGFVLPDGNRLHLERDELGSGWAFMKREGAPRPLANVPQPPFELSAGPPRALVLSAETVAQAQLAIDLAKAYGFKELWLHTHSPAALQAAIKSEIPTWLVIKPWEALPGATGLDQNLGSLSQKELLKLMTESPTFLQSLGFRQVFSVIDTSPSVSPDGTEGSRWARYVALAKTEGLGGVAVLRHRPTGYEKERQERFYFERIVSETFDRGYSVKMREAFLNAYHVDPIDITPPGLFFDSDLRQPFFLDDNLRGSSSVYSGRDVPLPEFKKMVDTWQKFRGDTLEKATLGLLGQLHASLQAPLYLERVSHFSHPSWPFGTLLIQWNQGDKIPEFNDVHEAPSGTMRYSFEFAPPMTDSEQQLLSQTLSNVVRGNASVTISFDLSGLSTEDAEKFMKRWLKPAAN